MPENARLRNEIFWPWRRPVEAQLLFIGGALSSAA